jgi:DNA modification methylase
MFVFSKDTKPNTATLICDKANKWAGHTNWGKNTHRNKAGDLIETKDIKPVPDFSPRNNIWTYQVNHKFNTNDKEAHKHPAIFPEKLVKDHILSWTKEGDLVLDPFAGSGTTLKVSDSLKRKFVGIERNGDYNKEIALPRLKKYIPTIELKIIEKVPEVIEEVIQEIIQNVVEEQGEEEYTDELLKKKKCPELKKICKSKKIKCYSRKRKNELIKLILNHKN